MAEKKLKLWNGRMSPPYDHGYVAAYSRADAIRVIAEGLGRGSRGMVTELRDYWSEGAWGNQMIGIKPERGLWAQKTRTSDVLRIVNGKTSTVERGPEWVEFQAKEKAEREQWKAAHQQEQEEKNERANRLADHLDPIFVRDVIADGAVVKFDYEGRKFEVREVE